MNVSPLKIQFLVAASTQLAAFSVGGAVTYPTLLMEQFGANDTSIELDLDTRSWIGSIYGLAGIPAVLMPIITHKIGRKLGFLMTCMFLLTGWILSYTASTAAEILVSEMFHGLGTNSLLPVSALSVTEMLAPKYRFLAMTMFGVVQVLGVGVCGIAGRYLHYKTLSIIMAIPISAAIATALIWPESPSWFACKGQFEKCEAAFIKLRGTGDIARKELKELITAQKENLTRTNHRKTKPFKDVGMKITRRDFYMPTFHTFVLLNMLYWSGGDVILIYFIQMVNKSTNSADTTLYASVIMYLIFFSGSIITNILLIRYRNKTVLLFSTCGVILCLVCTCVVTSLQTLGFLEEDSFLFMYCLLAYIACYGMGLNSIVFFIGAEIMPVKHRSIGGALYIIFNCTLYGASLKSAPYLFKYIGLFGTFVIYTVNAVVSALIVSKYVPETKGRTLQEIEDFYMNGRFIRRSVSSGNSVIAIANTL